jgi:1-acyl-sn-glycerol-3-phosphate acyltransferase
MVVLLLIGWFFIHILQLLSLTTGILGKNTYRKINRTLTSWWWELPLFCVINLRGLEFEISGDTIGEDEKIIGICNHQCGADIPLLLILAKKSKRLGDIKWFIKNILKFIPIIGWGLTFLDCLFVKRNWNSDKSLILKTFRKLKVYPFPFWLFFFPEGTRVTPKKLKQSQAYAVENSLPSLDHVLLPKSKGFSSSVLSLYDHIDAIVDCTIVFKPGPPSLAQLFLGKCDGAVIIVKRYPIKELPKDEQLLGKWLVSKFVEKDELIKKIKNYHRDRYTDPCLDFKCVDDEEGV